MSRKFDPTKDVQLAEWERPHSSGDSTLVAAVCQYNGGAKKLQLSREYNGDWRKLGRMTIGELEWLEDLLPEIKAAMREE